MVMNEVVAWGVEHTTQCTDDVLENCAFELYNFVNQCHYNKFNQSINQSTATSYILTYFVLIAVLML